MFGSTPNSLYAYAYDGVALASALSRQSDGNLSKYITHPDGYIGINGAFRITANGMSEHNLDIVEITESGLKTVNTSPQKFMPETYHAPSYPSQMPEIYGKNADVVYQKLSPTQTHPIYFDMF